jgi:hypothetical protein
VLFFYSFLLTFPVIILKIDTITLGFIDIISFTGFLSFIGKPTSSKIHISLSFCIALSFLSLFISNFLYFRDRNSVVTALLSLAYFFKIYFAFFAGLFCIRDYKDLKKLFDMIALNSVIILFLYGITCIQGGGSRFVDSFFSIPWLQIYGSVNHREAYFSTLTSLLIYLLINSKGNSFVKQVLMAIGILFGIYTAFSSGSRSSILLLITMIIFSSVSYVSLKSISNLFSFSAQNTQKLFLLLATIGVVVFVFAQGIIPMDTLLAKLELNSSSLESNQIGEITAGRDKIYEDMIEDIFQYPLFASAFHGFSPRSNYYGGSPHNQMLGSLWKMGFVSFLVYLQFIGRIFNAINLKDRSMAGWLEVKFVKVLCLSYAVALMPNQDTLTFPQTGVLLLFLCGCAVRCSDLHRGFKAEV